MAVFIPWRSKYVDNLKNLINFTLCVCVEMFAFVFFFIGQINFILNKETFNLLSEKYSIEMNANKENLH